MITRKAYAKINLSLDVVGRLENGYHEVRMIMQTIGLCDKLSFERFKISEPGEDRIRLSCFFGKEAAETFHVIKTSEKTQITSDEKDNLIYKAAALLMDKVPEDEGVKITLEKSIPMAAGMAGGSTDAAATLHGINDLFGLGLTDGYLCELGVKIGADIPYCIMGGTMLAEGIGEKLTRLPLAKGIHLVIAKPEAGVSTKYVYETLDSMENPPHPDVDSMLKVLDSLEAARPAGKQAASPSGTEAAGNPDSFLAGTESSSSALVASLSSLLGNSLESVTIPACPEVARIKQLLNEYGAAGCLMSGSGPTVFAIFPSETAAKEAAGKLADLPDCPAKDIFVTETL